MKECVGFSFLNAVSFSFQVYIFVYQNAWTLWHLNTIIPFKINIKEKPHGFAPVVLLLKQEV